MSEDNLIKEWGERQRVLVQWQNRKRGSHHIIMRGKGKTLILWESSCALSSHRKNWSLASQILNPSKNSNGSSKAIYSSVLFKVFHKFLIGAFFDNWLYNLSSKLRALSSKTVKTKTNSFAPYNTDRMV